MPEGAPVVVRVAGWVGGARALALALPLGLRGRECAGLALAMADCTGEGVGGALLLGSRGVGVAGAEPVGEGGSEGEPLALALPWPLGLPGCDCAGEELPCADCAGECDTDALPLGARGVAEGGGDAVNESGREGAAGALALVLPLALLCKEGRPLGVGSRELTAEGEARALPSPLRDGSVLPLAGWGLSVGSGVMVGAEEALIEADCEEVSEGLPLTLPLTLPAADDSGLAEAGAEAVGGCVGSALLLGSAVADAAGVEDAEPLLLPDSSRHVALLEAPTVKE